MKLLRANVCSLSDIADTANSRSLPPLFCRIRVLSGILLCSSALWKFLPVGLENVIWTLVQITVNKNRVSKYYKYLILFRYRNILPARIKILSLLALISAEWVLSMQHISPDLSQLADKKWGCSTWLWWIRAAVPAIRWDSTGVIFCTFEAAWL